MALAREWDEIALQRDDQLRQGRDLSFRYVLAPTILRLCAPCDWAAVVDAGCGTGVLTERLSRKAQSIVGVDASPRSIALARARSAIRYEETTIEAFSRERKHGFTLAVANMVLMTVPRLPAATRALSDLLKPGGHLVFSITHPWFWPAYWGYDRAAWFSYDRTIAIEAPFRISLAPRGLHRTTHIHRPLQTYATALREAGLVIEVILEPLPGPAAERKYPRRWASPRFLLARCRKEGAPPRGRL